MMPPNLVSVMPDSTDEPMRVSASAARTTRDPPPDTLNACTTCEQNSTAIPTAITCGREGSINCLRITALSLKVSWGRNYV